MHAIRFLIFRAGAPFAGSFHRFELRRGCMQSFIGSLYVPASSGLFRDFYFRILERTTPVIAGISAMSSLVEIRA